MTSDGEAEYLPKVRHKFLDIVMISVAAVIAGADNWVDVAEFAESKSEWLCELLELENGIPSHDTFGRVFSLLKPQAFEECFRAWVSSMRRMLPDEVVAIDGKSVRRSRDRGSGLGALHMVSAWAADNRLALGQVATEEKSNEITAIPRLLELLVLKGCIVTIDAMGCQTKLAEQIVDAGADYVLALKGNQSTLAEEVEEAFVDADAKDYADMDVDVFETVERGHGRKETRRYTVLGDLNGVSRRSLWKGLDAICMVESEREIDGHTSRECRFYIGSIGTHAERFAHAVRALGHREQPALDTRRCLSRRRIPVAGPGGPRELRRLATHGSDTIEERQIHQDRHQEQATESRMGQRLFASVADAEANCGDVLRAGYISGC